MATQILMPSLGMYTIEGELTRWLVADGAEVAAEQAILELTTEKSTVEINAPAGGILHQVAPAGAVVHVEALLGYVLAPGEEPPAPAAGATGSAPDAAAAAAAPRPGVVAAVPAAAGAGAAAGGPVRASPAARRRAKELGVALEAVTGTGPGGRITEADVQAAAAAPGPRPSQAVSGPAPPGPGAAGPVPGAAAAGGPVRASPAARRRAKELGVALEAVTGTGPGGRITEADVQAAAAATAAPAVGAGGRAVLRRVPLSGMRRVIATRMHDSLTRTAQLTLTREADAGPLIEARQRASAAVKVAFDVLLAQALARALLAQPALNAVVEGDDILLLDGVHVGIAVAVEGGLLVPVLRDAAHRPLADLAQDLTGLTDRARGGRLSPAEYEGGTVTITNLGAYGIDTFTPILNPPESAILGVGRIAPRPFVDDPADGAGPGLTVRPTVHLSLTFDHRVADGAAAAQLLEALVSEWTRLA
jgi:pyruvate dehydrogenase E2 component (dihydrolipoamide acetyltransferase)